jgi:hypothetical protein
MNNKNLISDSHSKLVVQLANQVWERVAERTNRQVWGRVTKDVWSQLDEQVAVQVRTATTQVQWRVANQVRGESI